MVVQIALPLPIAKTFSYLIPDRLQSFINMFQRVIVPFHNRYTFGYIVDVNGSSYEGLKEISDILDIHPLLGKDIERLCLWASNYYLTPIGLVFKYAVPKYIRPDRYLFVASLDRAQNKKSLNHLQGIKLEKAFSIMGKENVLECLQDGSITLKDRFTKKEFILYGDNEDKKDIKHEKILFLGGYRRRIEYYSELIETGIKKDKNILMLIPDYDTTGQFFYNTFVERFGERFYWYGSSIKQDSRMETYFRARNEKGVIIMGNKSSLFLPINNLSHIIIERHEEDSYRNENEFKFNAWEVGIKRAEIEGCPITLGTVAPKTEIFKRIHEGDFKVIRDKMPSLNIFSEEKIDKKVFFSGSLPHELIKITEDGKKERKHIIIYTPRKYFSSQLLCLSCNNLFICPVCRGILSYKKKDNKTVCSVCQRESEYKETCPQCGSSLIRFLQIGAEYIKENLEKILDDTEVVIITGDNIKKQIKRLWVNDDRQPEIIVGTSILSRIYGLRCHELIFLGLEEMINLGGYRAEERLFQILMNIIDALNPHKICFFIDSKKDFHVKSFTDLNAFYEEELTKRKNAGFPPYNRLYLVEVEKGNQDAGERTVERIKKQIKESGYTQYLIGPLFEKKKRYRWRFIIKNGQKGLEETLISLYKLKDTHIEVDPTNI